MASEPNLSIRARHQLLLSRPMKHKMTRKYVPEVIKHPYIEHPVTPIKNRRIDMLSVPNRFKKCEKWQEPFEPSTCVSRSVLEATCTARIDHLSKPTVRFLKAVLRDRGTSNKQFAEFIKEKIKMSLDTIYYHNVKSLMNIAEQKRKAKKWEPPKKKTFEEFGNQERLLILALAKPKPKPRSMKKRKWKKLEELVDRINSMSLPKYVYKRPSQDSMIKKLGVSPKALVYQVTERVNELAQLPQWKLEPPWVPPGVSKAALKYVATDNIKKLAEPAPRSQQVDSDLKENPFEISPAALKYKATPRIIEIAKPIER